MIRRSTVGKLVANQAFRAFMSARARGVPGDSLEQTATALHVLRQIEVVRNAPRDGQAVKTLREYIDAYLNAYGEQEPPYLPAVWLQLNTS